MDIWLKFASDPDLQQPMFTRNQAALQIPFEGQPRVLDEFSLARVFTRVTTEVAAAMAAVMTAHHATHRRMFFLTGAEFL